MTTFPRPMGRCFRAALLVAQALLLAACGSLPQPDAATAPSASASAMARYNAAIADAAVVSPGKIRPLRVVPATDSVSVVSWVSESRLPCPGGAAPCTLEVAYSPLWVTLTGEVQALCRSWGLQGDALRQRLEQLLGLPPDQPPQYQKTRFATLLAPRAALQRPCLGVDSTAPAQPVCTLAAQADTPAALQNFVGQQMAGSYVVGGPNGPGYPFTRLGYTYDWAQPPGQGAYGASEFLVPVGTRAPVVAIVSTDAYCQPAP